MGAVTRRLRRSRVRLWAAVSAVLALAGCREGPELFQPADRAPLEGQAWQLTYSVFDDRMPAWLSGGDSLVYSTVGFDSLPRSPNVLVGIPARGGIAEPVFRGVQMQIGVGHRFVAPAVSPDGERLAYVELWNVQPARPLSPAGPVCDDGDRDPTFPTLEAARLRVRRLDATGAIAADPVLPVEFDGHDFFLGGGRQGVNLHVTRHHPFHTLFDQDGSAILRPTWSPDGGRLAFSDGLRLYLWNVGASEPLAIPHTADGVLPAWSPDGQWLAFTRLGRTGERISYCEYYSIALIAVQRRHFYAVAGRTLVLVRPDGSELRELGEGEAPAWAPDGSAVYATRGGQLWRIPIDGSAASPVPNTDAAREPAVSPDGNRLAFTRRLAGGDYNVWVLSLDGS